MSTHITKSLSAENTEIVEPDKGEVTAVVCTYGVVDKDGDVVQKGAIKDGTPVILSRYNHDSITGSTLPVGKGTIVNVGNEAILTAKYFLDTEAGRETFAVVKALAEEGLGEWSWGFKVTDAERGEFEGKSVQFIKATDTFEASFVAVGAGVNTRTLAAKAEESLKRSFSAEERERLAKEGKAMSDGSFPIVTEDDLKNAVQAIGRAKDPAAAKSHIKKRARALGLTDLIPEDWKSYRFAEHGGEVVASLKEFRDRAAEVLAMRQEKGKSLGEESRETIEGILEVTAELKSMLDAEPETPAQEAIEEDDTLDLQNMILGVLSIEADLIGETEDE